MCDPSRWPQKSGTRTCEVRVREACAMAAVPFPSPVELARNKTYNHMDEY